MKTSDDDQPVTKRDLKRELQDYATKGDLQNTADGLQRRIQQEIRASEARIGKMVGELISDALHLISERFDRVEARLDRVEARLDRVESTMDEMNYKLDLTINRVDGHELRISRLERRKHAAA